MVQKTNEKKRETFLGFLNRIRVLLVVLFSLLIISIIAFFVIMEINRTRSERAIAQVYTIETELQELNPDERNQEELPLIGAVVDEDGNLVEQEDDADDAIVKQAERSKAELIAALKDTVDEYPRQYGGIRARYLIAQSAWKEKNYGEAFEYFDQIIRDFFSSHFIEMAYLGAAAALEALDRLEDALTYYQEGLEELPDALTKSRMQFSIGRLHDTLGNTEEAYTQFEQLFNNDNSSIYGKLAKTRILALQKDTDLQSDTASDDDETESSE